MDLFLDQIKDPSCIKEFSTDELEVLAWSIRNRIIEVMSKNGGHLSSNLGAVELTIALHYCFNSPLDKIIFDTSHQSYTHKILTGRNHLFDSIRKYKGLSGFTSPSESIHDHFFAGHAATALSLALGVAKGRDLKEEDFYALPVVGDAAFTCGLTHEALNNIPKDLKKFILILNDNAMSISKNVGAITEILRSFLPEATSKKIYNHIEKAMKKLCSCEAFGSDKGIDHQDPWVDLADTAPFFEQYGLNYIGPIDGHNIKDLIEVFEKIKKKPNRPYILHLLTHKGQGMDVAKENPTCYHGARPFDKISGSFLQQSSHNTFPKIFGQHLMKIFDSREDVIALTPAMPSGSCIEAVMQKFPKRCLDVGIAEGHCVTFAGGIALDRSIKVIVSIYATFLQRALDNLFQDVCLQNAPVIFALDRAGLAGGDGATHNGIYDIGFLKGMPNLIIAQPRSGKLLRELLTSALNYEKPTAIRYPNLTTDDTTDNMTYREVGKAEVISKGSNIAFIALGHHVATAIKVKERLIEEGLDITIVDPIFIKPIDEDLLAEVFRTHQLIITLEEHSLSSGFGEIINSFAARESFSNQILNLGIPDIYIEQGSHQELLKELHLDVDSITKKIISCLPVHHTI